MRTSVCLYKSVWHPNLSSCVCDAIYLIIYNGTTTKYIILGFKRSGAKSVFARLKAPNIYQISTKYLPNNKKLHHSASYIHSVIHSRSSWCRQQQCNNTFVSSCCINHSVVAVLTLDMFLLRASEARRVRREILAHLELLDPPVPEDPLEMTVQRVTL